jgi:hypothetical protein
MMKVLESWWRDDAGKDGRKVVSQFGQVHKHAGLPEAQRSLMTSSSGGGRGGQIFAARDSRLEALAKHFWKWRAR